MTLVISQKADEIKKLHGEIFDHARTSLEKAIRIGELLSDLQKPLKHGKQWLRFLEEEVSFSDQTARNYIRLYEQRDDPRFKNVLNLGLSEAYRMLTPPRERDGERRKPTGKEVCKASRSQVKAITTWFRKWDRCTPAQVDQMKASLQIAIHAWPDSVLEFLQKMISKHLDHTAKVEADKRRSIAAK